MFVHYILVWDYFLNVEGVVLGPGGAYFAPRRSKISPPPYLENDQKWNLSTLKAILIFVHYILVWDYFMNIEGVVLGPGEAYFTPRRCKISPPLTLKMTHPLNGLIH